MSDSWYSKYERLRKVFSHKNLSFHYMFKYLTGQISKSVLFSLIKRERLNRDGTISLDEDYLTDRFEIMRWFNLLNKSKWSKACVFLRGGFIHIRVLLFNFQCWLLKGISNNVDAGIILGIFGLQFFLQTALIMSFVDNWKLLWFFGLFVGQFVLFFFAIGILVLYIIARELSV